MNWGLIKYSFLALYLICSFRAHGYVINVGVSGEKLVWSASAQNLSIAVNPTNSSGLSSLSVNTMVTQAAAGWSSASGKSISLTTGSTPKDNSNDLYFSSSSHWFGGSSGIVGLTQVAYDEVTGKIIEGDIVINDQFEFSQNPTDEFYLGNVVAHEMGHFLGLSHSQLPRATMFYRLRRGQHELGSDDEAAGRAIRNSGRGHFISGNVIGGSTLIPVFGSHISAISLNSGEVVAGAISDQSGGFTIYGLDASDSYYLYIEPIKNLASLPDYYKDAKKNFCDSGTNYRGSFFENCFSTGVGHPQLIQMNGASQNIGSVTIKCQLESPPEYLASKGGSFDFRIDSNETTGELEATKSFVGYFSEAMLEGNQDDVIEINLPDLQAYPQLQGRDLYLDVKILSQDFYSIFQYNVETDGDSPAISKPLPDRSRFDGDHLALLDTHLEFPLLSINGPSWHQIRLTPQTMNTFLANAFDYYSEYPYMPSRDDYFPALDQGYRDNLAFYLVVASLRERGLDGTSLPVALSKNKRVFNNLSCPDASRTYSVAGSVSKTASAGARGNKEEASQVPLACGSVDFGGPGGGSGPAGILLLLAAALIVGHSRREALKYA